MTGTIVDDNDPELIRRAKQAKVSVSRYQMFWDHHKKTGFELPRLILRLYTIDKRRQNSRALELDNGVSTKLLYITKRDNVKFSPDNKTRVDLNINDFQFRIPLAEVNRILEAPRKT